MREPNKNPLLHDWIQLLRRRKVLFLAGAAVFSIAVLIGSHYVPLKYTSKAIFEFGLEAAADQISQTGQEPFLAVKERLLHDVGGYAAIESTMEELGLTRNFQRDKNGQLTEEGKAAQRQAVEGYMKCIEVVWENRSKQEDLISVRFTHWDPKLAARMCNALVAGYINRTYARIETSLRSQCEYIAARLGQCEKTMVEMTTKKVRFETEHAGILPENPAALQEKIQRMRTDLEALRRQQAVARNNLARLQAMARQPRGGDAAVQVVRQPNPEIPRLKEQIQALKDERESNITVKHMTVEHPTMRALAARIACMEKRLKDAPVEVIKETLYGAPAADTSVAMAAASSELDVATREIDRIEPALANLEKLWDNFAPVRQNFLSFSKEYEDCNKESENWRRRKESVETALAATVNRRLMHLNAIQPGQEQLRPASPSLLVILGIALLGGLAFGGGLAFVAQILDRSIRSPQEIGDYFDVPVHGIIGEIVTPRQRALRAVWQWTIGPLLVAAVLAALAAAVASVVLRLEHPAQYVELLNVAGDFLRKAVAGPFRSALGCL